MLVKVSYGWAQVFDLRTGHAEILGKPNVEIVQRADMRGRRMSVAPSLYPDGFGLSVCASNGKADFVLSTVDGQSPQLHVRERGIIRKKVVSAEALRGSFREAAFDRSLELWVFRDSTRTRIRVDATNAFQFERESFGKPPALIVTRLDPQSSDQLKHMRALDEPFVLTAREQSLPDAREYALEDVFRR